MMTTMMSVGLAGMAVLAAATLLNLLLGRASASLRHLVWAAAVGALVALPVAEFAGVRFEVPIPGWYGPAEPAGADPVWADGPAMHAVSLDRSDETVATREALPAFATNESAGAASGRVEVATASTLSARPAVEETAEVAAQPSGPIAQSGSAPAVVPWAILMAMTWGLGALLLLVHTGAGHWTALRISTKGVRDADETARTRLDRLARRVGIRRHVDVRVSDGVRVPATWGLRRSAIILPPDFSSWSEDRLERVLLHELAHVARRDCLTHLVGDVARAIHWPNPLAWWAVYRLRVESERACDDRVLEGGSAASAYADDLVGIARELKRARPLPDPMLAMAGGGGIVARIAAILDPERARSRPGPRAIAAAAAIAAVLTLSVSGFTPVAQERPSEPERPPVEPVPVAVASVDPEPVVVPRPRPQVTPDPQPVVAPDPVSVPEPVPNLEAPLLPETRPTWEAEPAPEPPAQAPPVWRQVTTWAAATFASAQAQQSQELCPFRDGERQSTSSNVDDERMRIRWETDDCRVEVTIEGDVEFTADDREVADMDRGALFEIEWREGRSSRRVRMEGTNSGIEQTYWVDGDRVAWGAQADAWVAQVLPELFRRTTFNAEPRVRRMLAEGGAERVFREVDNMDSDHVARRYLELLIEHGDLTEREYVRVIDRGGDFESDHHKASILLHVVEVAGLRPAFQDPLLDAARELESDHQMAKVLTALLQSDLSSGQLDEVVRTAQALESDHQLATVLSEVARQGRLSDAGRSAFVETLASIESDHQHATVLGAFLDAGSLSDEELTQVLSMTRGLESDHQRAAVLQRVAMEYDLSPGQATAYLASAREIESDHQLAATALVVLDKSDFNSDHVDVVIEMSATIDSDHQRAAVLQALLDGRRFSDADYMRILGSAEDIESDHQLAAVLMRMIEHDGDLSRPVVTELLGVTGQIGSDHQQASVLVRIANELGMNADQEDRIRTLASRFSDHQERQVLAALGRRSR